jgi:OmpA-OmpF porin, OOP family
MKIAFSVIVLGFALSLVACKKPPEKIAAPAAPATPPTSAAPATPVVVTPPPAAPVATTGPAAAPATLMAELDWNTVPESTVDMGAYPYFKAPETMRVDGNDKNVTAGVSEVLDFSQLITYTGESFYAADGKVTKINYRMDETSKNFNQYLFDKSVDSYILSLGAKLLFKGQIPKDKLKELNKTDDLTVHKFMIGDVWNSDPVRLYALKQKDKRMVIQLFSNSATGNLGFVELKEFKQTIQKYSAEGMKKEIDATGKAIVNINFDTDKASLKADGQEVVNQITALLKGTPALKLSIEGHTDNTGSVERNKALSTDRANAVVLALVSAGIGKDNLKAAGFGSDKPLVANDSEANKAKNRRVELVKF